MQAGRELDELVAKNVMGMWKDRWYDDQDHWWQIHHDGKDKMHASIGLPYGGCAWRSSLPRFSSDLAAAFTVVEKMSNEFNTFVLGEYTRMWQVWTHALGPEEGIGLLAESPSLPHAICLAALACRKAAEIAAT